MRSHVKIILVKCPFRLCLNPVFDEFITIDEMTADVRSNSKIWGHISLATLPFMSTSSRPGQGTYARNHLQFLPGNTGCG